MPKRLHEIIDKRTVNSKHYLNDDGLYTAEISSSPIHYEDAETGKLEDIDLNIIEEQNFEFEYALKKNTFRAYFNDVTDIENYTLAGFELINKNGVARWINFKMYGAEPTSDSREKNRFKYHSVFPNVDLEYIVTPSRLKENIIVHDSSALQAFTFTLKLDDMLKMEIQEDNSIHFIDVETDKKLWEIDKPFAVDSSEGKLRTENISYVFGKETYNGVEYDSITVEISDEDFLSNAVYPIVIDPTVKVDEFSLTNGSKITIPIPSGAIVNDAKVTYFGKTKSTYKEERETKRETLSDFRTSELQFPDVPATASITNNRFSVVGRYFYSNNGTTYALSIPEGMNVSNDLAKTAKFQGRARRSGRSAYLYGYVNGRQNLYRNSSIDYNIDEIELSIGLRTDYSIDTKNPRLNINGNIVGYYNGTINSGDSREINIPSEVFSDGYDVTVLTDDESILDLTLELTYTLKTKVGEFHANGLIIPIYDPSVGMDNKNQLRTFDKNGNVACFELVDITDSLATPFRVSTNNGIKAIAKE